jgi:hypothetical protein
MTKPDWTTRYCPTCNSTDLVVDSVVISCKDCGRNEILFHSAHRRMLPVLGFDPVRAASGAVAAIDPLRYLPFEPPAARRPK